MIFKENKIKMKQKRVYEVQNESSSEKISGGWVLKSTPFIVCDIFLERYVTAGVLSESNS